MSTENKAQKVANTATAPAAQSINTATEQVRMAAAGGLALLSRETTLVPGNLRQQVAVLEGILGGIMNGSLLVVTAQSTEVESSQDEPKS